MEQVWMETTTRRRHFANNNNDQLETPSRRSFTEMDGPIELDHTKPNNHHISLNLIKTWKQPKHKKWRFVCSHFTLPLSPQPLRWWLKMIPPKDSEAHLSGPSKTNTNTILEQCFVNRVSAQTSLIAVTLLKTPLTRQFPTRYHLGQIFVWCNYLEE